MNQKIYHIVHIDRLPSIIDDGFLWSDSEMEKRNIDGTTIGMSSVKERRMNRQLECHNNLKVGQCVPFYFCPRSVMLYVIHKANHSALTFHGGQQPIIHLVVDLSAAINWADQNGLRWAFTDSNATAGYTNHYNGIKDLNQLDWQAINASDWQQCQDKKQAEFLIESQIPIFLVEEIGVYSKQQQDMVIGYFKEKKSSSATTTIRKNWYY